MPFHILSHVHLQQCDFIAKSVFHLDTFLPFHSGSFLVFSGCQLKEILGTWQLCPIPDLLAKVLCFLSSQPLFSLHRIFCDLLRRIPGLKRSPSDAGLVWKKVAHGLLTLDTLRYWSYSMVKSSAAESRCGDSGGSGPNSGTLRLHGLRFSSESANSDMPKALAN